MSDDVVHFGVLDESGYAEIRTIKQGAMRKCPHFLIDPDHYRDDETCKCDDAEERERLKQFGYTDDDFAGIPLRGEQAKGES